MSKHLTPKQEEDLRTYFLTLVLRTLPDRAAKDPAFPIRTMNDFARVVLDLAAGPDWVLTMRPPAFRTLPIQTIVRAIAYCRLILTEGAGTCVELNERSLQVSLTFQPTGKVGPV